MSVQSECIYLVHPVKDTPGWVPERGSERHTGGVLSETPRPDEHHDGRVARGERTRRLILDAHSALLREGNLRPTAIAVAGRAGVSIRALWANFKDLEGLVEAASVEWVRDDPAHETDIDPDLPMAERVQRFCAQRARRMEAIAPALRASALEPNSPAVARQRQVIYARNEGVVRAVFATELDRAADAASEVVVALMTGCSARCWLVMRDDLGLAPDAAEAVMHRAAHAVLAEFADPPTR